MSDTYKCNMYYIGFEIERVDANCWTQTDSPKEIIGIAKHWHQNCPTEIKISSYYCPNTIEIGLPYYETKHLYQWGTEENPVKFIERFSISHNDDIESFIEEFEHKYRVSCEFFTRNEALRD